MSGYENFAIPQLEDGRDFISAQLVADVPELSRFVHMFPDYYTFDFRLNGWVSPPQANTLEDHPTPSKEP